jgi:hypothetical protein
LHATSTGVADVPQEHQAGRADMEAVQCPDRPKRQADDVHRVNQIAEVGQNDVAEAVGGEVFEASEKPNGIDDVGQYQYHT